MAFDIYDAVIRLNGSVSNELFKSGLTAPEIEILREIHGSDAVVRVEKTGTADRTSQQERKRLVGLYANPNELLPEEFKRKNQILRDLFGHDRTALPETLEESSAPADPVDEPAKPSGRFVKKASATPAFAE